MVTRSDLSLIAVRIVALYLIADGIGSLPVLHQVWRTELGEFYSVAGRRWITAGIAAPIVLGIAAFLLSRPLARLVVPRGEQPQEPAANLSGIQSVAIATIGLFLIALTLPNLITNIMVFDQRIDRYSSYPSEETLRWFKDPRIVGQMATVALGVILSTGASYWTRLLRKFRDLGYSNSRTKTG